MFKKILGEMRKDEHVLIAVVIILQMVTLVYDIGKMVLYFWLKR